MPTGALATLPRPSPSVAIRSEYFTRSKRAVQLLSASMVTVAVRPVPTQAPDQPANTDPSPAAAASVTAVPCGYCSAQSAEPSPQAMPNGELPTLPAPSPVVATVRVRAIGSNRAVHVLSASITTV